ncbi:MAG: DUF6644 family protein [Pseudomonadota bacterium]|nr:DUF6644 family protein [Pseudomonadota bacterium]
MSIQVVSNWISQTSLSEAIRDHFWVVPTVQAVHICAIAVLVAGAMISELRIVGLFATDEAASAIVKRHLPWMWSALLVLLFSGVLLVWGEPDRSLSNRTFWIKMGLVFSGFSLSVLFRRPLLRPEFDLRAGASRWLIKPLAWLSLFIWVAVVCAGRWIAYS